jgi:hypothetical protein
MTGAFVRPEARPFLGAGALCASAPTGPTQGFEAVVELLNHLSSRAIIVHLAAFAPLAQPVVGTSAATRAPNAVPAVAASLKRRTIAATVICVMLGHSAGEHQRILDR